MQVDVVSLTRANCAQPMTFYSSMVLVLLGFKIVLLLIVVAPFLVRRLRMSAIQVKDRRRRSSFHSDMARLHSLAAQASADTGGDAMPAQFSPTVAPPKVSWSRLLKLSFMFLFMAYPGVSLKLMRLFKCRNVEGVWWLAADMRLRCYTGEWAGYAVYAVIMIALYVIGLPLTLFQVLWRRRYKLFGERSTHTRLTYGFLYESYGPGAWWWEIEELIRKLLLSAVVVLIDAGSPLQVTVAVLVSGWAHVLHAMYKPWGAGSLKYRLQHGSLFVTSFVFLMGLLFKVEGVSSSSDSYRLLSEAMLLFAASFIACWALAVLLVLTRTLSSRHPSLERRLPLFLTTDKVGLLARRRKSRWGVADDAHHSDVAVVPAVLVSPSASTTAAAHTQTHLHKPLSSLPSSSSLDGTFALVSNPMLAASGGSNDGGGCGSGGSVRQSARSFVDRVRYIRKPSHRPPPPSSSPPTPLHTPEGSSSSSSATAPTAPLPFRVTRTSSGDHGEK
jgi:hypothetical protein